MPEIMLRRGFVISLVFAVAFTCFCFGIVYGQEVFEPQVIEKPVVHTADHYIYSIKEIEIEKPVKLREFASLKELKEWLANDNTNGGTIIVLHFVPEGVDPNFDCDDYATALQMAAEKGGYRMSVQLQPINMGNFHAVNSVFIGNDCYFIEPQTDEVWLECYRDRTGEKE